MHVVFAGRLVCSVNMLYMELSYTGSLDQSTRASEHVTVQISLKLRLDKVYTVMSVCACGLCWYFCSVGLF